MLGIVLVVGGIILLWTVFSASGALFWAIEMFGWLGVIYFAIAMCTGIGAFCAVVFGFVYWLDKIDKKSKKTT